jgi:TrmH family RNA methyltransferase
MKLTSHQNPRIKHAYKLRNRRDRERERLTLLEGYRELSRAFEFGMKLDECFYCPEMFLGQNEMPLLDKLNSAGTQLFEVSDDILRKLSYRDRPEGLIAVAGFKEHSLENFPIVQNGLYLIAEAVEKPGNLGSILRSADAAGADGVIVCDKCTDIYNPNVIRASTGALFSVPLAETDAETALNWLKQNNIKSLAATPHTDNLYTDENMRESVAILVGTEQYGLSEFWMNQADCQVRIPMLGLIDSLNVATATTILLYEAARQRDWEKR